MITDVECLFGILKGRFGSLKLPIFHRKKEHVDCMFFTCVTLHNMPRAFDHIDVLEADVEGGGKGGLHGM